MPDKKNIVTGFVSAALIFFILFGAGLFLMGDPMLHEATEFSLTAYEIAAFYPLPVVGRSTFDGAERELFSMLDPFSYRIDKSDYDYLREESSGEYGGIGISVVPRDTTLMVMSVREGSPAYDGGMKSGDCIISVDGKKVPANNPGSATDWIRGPSGTTIRLTIYRPTIADTLALAMMRGNIKLEHIPYYGMADNGFAYIRIADFEAGTAQDLRDAVDSLEKSNARGYIIDLKGNPGGYLNEAIDASEMFLSEGMLIVGTDGRSRWDNQRFVSSSDPLTDKPVIILTDRGSASAAEIFTGALKGADRAVVIGDTTFGKGLVQTVYALPNQDAIRLTVSRYYFADGRYLNPPDSALSFSGLAPDLVDQPQGELAFQELVLSGFLIYDFVEAQWSLLSSLPNEFNYPDTVLTLFRQFALAKGIAYRSWLTEIVAFTIMDQRLGGAPDAILSELERMKRLSDQLDGDVFRRYADLLKFHIRRVAVEKKTGRAASYRDVIVPGRSDIRLAVQLLSNPERYRSYLPGPPIPK